VNGSTVPEPRMEPTVIGLITQGLAEVRDALGQLSRDLHGTLTRLPTEYVPRREVERRLDELIIDLGAERAARERALSALGEASEKLETERRLHRRWLIGLGAGTFMSGVGVLSGIVLHFQ
jgi:hypothetical protein